MKRLCCTYAKLQIAVVFSIVFLLLSYLTPGYAEGEEKPSSLTAQRLCEQLDSLEKSMHLVQADALHSEQEKILTELQEQPEDWCELFLTGVMIAVEEYYELELSYPVSAKALTESGCLLQGWSDNELQIMDFDVGSNYLTERILVYIPQPLGLNSIKPVPGMSCSYTRRCFEEYSLAIPEQSHSTWLGESEPITTYWMEPFLAFSLLEIAHMNRAIPGDSQCASCR